MKAVMSVACSAFLLAGCVTYPSPVDESFGGAVTDAKARQVLDPDAPSRQRPVLGTDAQAAKLTVDRYERSFETPPPPVNIFTIGIGSGTATGTPTAR